MICMNAKTDLTDKAIVAAEAGDFAAAVQLFADALQIDPHDAALHEQQAQCFLELEQCAAAASAARRATALKPCWPEAWLTLARALLNGGHLQEAQHACSVSLDLDPTNTDARDEWVHINGLIQQQTCRRTGLVGLDIRSQPWGQAGPGCVIWEAGVQLAQMFVSLAALQRGGGVHVGTAIAGQPPPEPSAAAPGQLQHQHAAGHTGLAACAQPDAAVQNKALKQVHLLELPKLHGARLLELGAGTGIAGIAAAACGAQVTLTDLPANLPLLQANIAHNQQLIEAAGGSAAAVALDWAALRQQCELETGAPCIIANCAGAAAAGVDGQAEVHAWSWAFGADLVFNHKQVHGVVHAVSELVLGTQPRSHRCSCFVMAHKQRHPDVDGRLLEAFTTAGCRVRELVLGEGDCSTTDQVCLWLIDPL